LNQKIRFNTQFLSQPALVVANKLHVEQVLLNILINAQHAILARENVADNDQGRISLKIDKVDENVVEDLNYKQPYLCITVKDNGIGMSPEIREKIFEKYFTTRKAEGGTGLGLAVSENIVLSHANCIKVHSEIGRGTEFKIYFPFYADVVM
jgi:two-component system, cell cycle sensor histidine kinase and response regulator CckA